MTMIGRSRVTAGPDAAIRWLVVAAALVAVAVLVVGVVLTARYGVDSRALIFAVPPLVVLVVAGGLLYLGTRFRSRPPLVIALFVEGLAGLVGLVSFITPLLLTVVVAALLASATLLELLSG